jgi:16S rRNA (adenine1518-N6/adenine1519-N6)-dimethyltransferase
MTGIKETLKKYNLKPKKYFGQNFLIENNILEDIIKGADLKKSDTVLEIGPGLGNLTKKLAKNAKEVITIEKDREFVKILENELQVENIKNVEMKEGDALKLETKNLKIKNGYKLVANLPYYITSPIIRKFLEEKNYPKLMVLMVQKEVAERICAKPPKMTILSVASQLYSKPQIIKIVKKECFWPKPKVDSAILKLENITSGKFSLQFRNNFFKIVKTGFSSPRKQLKNNLKNIFGEKTEEILKKTSINGTRRAESLSVKEWQKITKGLAKKIKK